MFPNITTKIKVFDTNGKDLLKKAHGTFRSVTDPQSNKHLFCLQFPAAIIRILKELDVRV